MTKRSRNLDMKICISVIVLKMEKMLTHFLSSLRIKRFAIKNRNDTTYI